MKVEISQVISQIIAFFIMLWILRKYAWKPILQVMDERKKKIQGDFNAIAEQKKTVQALEDQYQKRLVELEHIVHDEIQKAVDEGRQRSQAILDKAHSDARAILAKGQEDLQREIKQAQAKMKEEIVKIVMATTEKVLEKTKEGNVQEEAVLQLLQQGEKS